MITACPHCQAEIEIDARTHAALAGQSHFACPACQGAVPVPGRRPGTASAHRGLNRNFLILGTLALLVLGGLGFYLASKGSGDSGTTTENIHNEIINNSYFQNLIASGATTQSNLDKVDPVLSCGDDFLGVTREKLTWEQALILARSVHGEILHLPSEVQKRNKVVHWLNQNMASHLTIPVWVQNHEKPHSFDGAEAIEVSDNGCQLRALIRWTPSGSNRRNQNEAAIALSQPLHRWSFNGDVRDSIGSAHGTVIDPGQKNARFWNGQLDLSANLGQMSESITEDAYVDLPNRLVEGLSGKLSIELWCTQSKWASHANLFRFQRHSVEGQSAPGGSSGDSRHAVIGLQQRSFGNALLGYLDFASKGWHADSGIDVPSGTENHYVFVLDPSDPAAGKGGTQSLYLNGKRVARGEIPIGFLDKFGDNDNWLGRGAVGGPVFSGMYNELRIYNNALSQQEVLASYEAGPDRMVSAKVP